MDSAWCKLSKKYRDMGEKRDILTLPLCEYEYLKKMFQQELDYAVNVVDSPEEEDVTIRSFAFSNIKHMQRYIKMMEEAVMSTDGESMHVPFYSCETDCAGPEYMALFLHLLAYANGNHYII